MQKLPVLLTLALLAGAARPLTQQATFRSTTALVEVDVSVLDGNGNFVSGLQPDDLTVFEDGQPQKIQQFYAVTRDPASAQTLAPGHDRTEAEQRARRFFLFMIDEGHLSPESLMRAKKGVENFIDRQMAPGDMAGVFANGELNRSRMTDDRVELLGAVRKASVQIDNRDALLATFREFPVIPDENAALRIAMGANEVAADLAAKACASNPFECQLAGGAGQMEHVIQQKASLYIRTARVLTEQTLQNLEYVSANLARLAGRKTVVLLTDGFFTEESRPQLEHLAGQAARGGTTIYAIDPRGLVNSAGRNPDVLSTMPARSLAFDTGDEGPAILASGTGGLHYHGIDDIAKAIGMAAHDTSSYYVIGYAPPNATMDGKYRSIKVKASADGLHIRARHGYLAVNLPPQEIVRSKWPFDVR